MVPDDVNSLSAHESLKIKFRYFPLGFDILRCTWFTVHYLDRTGCLYSLFPHVCSNITFSLLPMTFTICNLLFPQLFSLTFLAYNRNYAFFFVLLLQLLAVNNLVFHDLC